MRDAVAAAESLRHRVAEAEARAAEGSAGVHGALEQLPARLAVASLGEHAGERGGDQACAGERLPVGIGVAALDVERLRTMRERVQRRAARLTCGQPKRQLRVVDDARHAGAAAADLDAALLVADAETRRPLRAGVRRRDRDHRQARRRAHRLGGVDRAPAPKSDEPVGACGGCHRLLDGFLGHMLAHARVARGRRKLEVVPAAGRDQKRPFYPDLRQETGNRVEPPAHDHAATRSRANSRNASAALVGGRAFARTTYSCREGSRPATRAAARVPAASSPSTAVREMNATP